MGRSTSAGSYMATCAALRFSQCETRSLSSDTAQATPPSRKAIRSRGLRRVTPPRNSDLHIASPDAAKLPMWL